jgi:hypothetical protein
MIAAQVFHRIPRSGPHQVPRRSRRTSELKADGSEVGSFSKTMPQIILQGYYLL